MSLFLRIGKILQVSDINLFTFTDLGKNAEIEYLLEDSLGGKFSIGRIDGVLRSVKVLDREEQGVYKLSVTAIDNGSPR